MGGNRQARARAGGRWGTRTLLMGMLVAALVGAGTALLGCFLAAPAPRPAPEGVHSRPVRLPEHARTVPALAPQVRIPTLPGEDHSRREQHRRGNKGSGRGGRSVQSRLPATRGDGRASRPGLGRRKAACTATPACRTAGPDRQGRRDRHLPCRGSPARDLRHWTGAAGGPLAVLEQAGQEQAGGWDLGGATDVAKAAAGAVVTRGGLADIVDLVEESRRIHQRSLTYALKVSVEKVSGPRTRSCPSAASLSCGASYSSPRS